MRVHADSAGQDPAALRRGRDVVLHMEEGHAAALEPGVLASDHLDMDRRAAVDDDVVEALERWHEGLGGRLAVEGVDLAWIWERDLLAFVFMPVIRTAVALDAAVEALAPSELTVMDRDGRTELIVSVVARRRGIPCAVAPDARSGAAHEADHKTRAPVPLRRRLLTTLIRAGAPSLLRRNSVLFCSYWPMVPLLDEMLSGEPRPAIWLEQRPAGARRAVRAALRGGVVTGPGPRTRARARRLAARTLGQAGPPAPLTVQGLELGEVLHRHAIAMGARRAAGDIADALLLRRVFARGRIRQALVPYDIEPRMRLLTFLAREQGVRTLLVAHGAYPLRHTIVDMQVADEIAIWSETFGPTVWDGKRPLHVVGYPLPHSVSDPRPAPGGDRPEVLVLGRAKETQTARFDDRYVMDHYTASVDAVLDVFPRARIVLRPAPAEAISAAEAVAASHPDADVRVERQGDISVALERADICLAVPSTAAFQAALTGIPVIVPNLSGYDWWWPLGGDTEVPLPTSRGEVAEELRRWQETGSVPGREQLLEALGADGSSAVPRLAALLRR